MEPVSQEAASTTAPVAEMAFEDAVKLVIRVALAHDGLKKGLHESVRALDRHAGRLCFLAKDCNSAEYTTLVQALAAESGINVISVPSGKELAAWCGLAKLTLEGEVRKVPKCSCAVITDFGETSDALRAVQKHVDMLKGHA